MCAIIGAVLTNPTQEDLSLIRDVFYESRIRGLHATGASWVKNKKINTLILPIPANQFIDKLDITDCINEDGNLYLIGHCRYSTSDLQYNQPIYNKDISVVHNGVVSQEMPENWQSLYGYKCNTKNDSELILRTVEANNSPLEQFPDSSIAAIELYKNKKLRFYRNGKRPIYVSNIRCGVIITSTKNIAKRAIGSKLNSISIAEMNSYMQYDNGIMFETKVNIQNSKDLQIEEN